MNGKKAMKKSLSVFLAFVFVLSVFLPSGLAGLTAQAEGTHTADNWSSHADTNWNGSNPTITTAAQLAELAVLVNGGTDFRGSTITLGADIDLGGHSWVPIGDTSHTFKGTFDGQNHTISGLTIGTSENPDGIYNDVGLFGDLGQGADVKDTNLTGISIYSALDYVGGMAGVSSCITDYCPVGACTIEGCSVSGIIQSTATGALVGGLVSDNEGGTIQKCHTCVNITGGDRGSIGGLVGKNYMGSVEYCYAGGNITCGGGCTAGGLVSWNEGRMISGNIISGIIQCCYAYGNVASGATDDEYGSNVGGLVGVNYLNSEIQNCYSVLGTVTGDSGFGSNFGACGGLVGDNMGNITKSFSANGTVTATINESDKHTGGLVGENEVRSGICTGTITNCYFDVHTTGQASDGQLYDGTTFTTNGSGATPVTDSSALIGDTAKTTLTGFDFSPDSPSDSPSDSHIWETTTVDSCDTDWYPHLKAMSAFPLNYESNGGYLSWGSNTSENYYTAAFSENSLSRATRLGYDFSGWYTDPALTHEVDTSAHLIAATTLYAGWTPKSGAWSGHADTRWYHAADSSYTLSTAAELAGLADLVNGGNDFSGKTITLGADIDLGAYSWVPIGFSNPGGVDRSFKGNFDGGRHTITGLKIGTAQSQEVMYDNAGLFGSIADGSVKNVRVTEEIYLRPSTSFGGIAGTSAATIENCNASGILTGSGMLDVGGIVGSSSGTIRNCNATSTITSGGRLGGIVGYSTGTIENCHAAGTITAIGGNNCIGGISGVSGGPIQNCHASVILSGKDDDKVGGIAGVEDSASIQNCCATGTMTGENGAQVGGIVGSATGNVESCYASADVTGLVGANVGGLIGSNSAAQVMNCNATGNASGGNGASVGGLIGINQPHNAGAADFKITNCYATGSASGGDGAGIGGFVGNNIQSYKITNCYALGNASGGNSAAIGGFAGSCYAQDIEYSFSVGNVTGGETDAKVGGFTGAYNTSGATSSTGCYFDTHSGTLSDSYATGLTSDKMKGNAADTNMSALMNERYGDPGTAVWADTVADAHTGVVNWYPHLTTISLMIDFDSDGGAAVPSVSIPYYGAVSASSLPTPTRSGYAFAGWYTPDGHAFSSIVHALQGVALTAHWTAASYAGGGETASDYKASVSGADAGTSIPVAVDTKTGSAAVNIGALPKSAFSGKGTAAITVPAIKGVSSYSLGIPTDYLSAAGGKDTLTANTPSGSITIPSGMLAGTNGASGKQAEITIGKGDSSGLTAAEKAMIGNRPLIQLSMTIDGKPSEWSNPNASVTVSIPYTPTAAELKNPEAIVIWYIDGSGNAVCIPSGHYDAATGKVTFTTTHFSQYAVGFHKVSFSDITGSAWYANAVNTLAARNSIGGTGGGKFSPNAPITRAQFVAILAKMSGDSLSGVTSSAYSDVSSGDWYFAAAQWAKKSGVSVGSGDKFNPNAGITREQMATMLYYYAKYVGADVSNVEGMSVREFSDYGSISSWALKPIQWAINNKIVTGNGNRSFAPAANATRAEAAQMLAVLLQGNVK